MSPTVTTGSVGMNPPHYYFVKVVNISTSRDVVITHVWFVKADADVPVTNGTDPLPVRLRPDEGWEGWVNVVDLDDKPDAASAVVLDCRTGRSSSLGRTGRFHRPGPLAAVGARSSAALPGSDPSASPPRMDGMCGLLRHAEGIADLSPTALRAEPLRRASSTGSSAEADAPPAGEGRRGVRGWNRACADAAPEGGVRSGEPGDARGVADAPSGRRNRGPFGDPFL